MHNKSHRLYYIENDLVNKSTTQSYWTIVSFFNTRNLINARGKYIKHDGTLGLANEEGALAKV